MANSTAPVFTPTFNAFQRAADQMMGRDQWKALLQSAGQASDAVFSQSMHSLLFKQLAEQLEQGRVHVQDLESVKQSFSTFQNYIKDSDPVLAEAIQEALEVQADVAKSAQEKKDAFIAFLRKKELANSLALNLKAYLRPMHATSQEHVDKVVNEAFKTAQTDNEHRAAQAAYDPERDIIRMLFRLLHCLVEMTVSNPVAQPAAEPQAKEKERFIPMRG